MHAVIVTLRRLASCAMLLSLISCTHKDRETYLTQTNISLEQAHDNQLASELTKHIRKTLGYGSQDMIRVIYISDIAMICGSVLSRQDGEFLNKLISKLKNPRVINATHVSQPTSLKQQSRDLYMKYQLKYALWQYRHTAQYKIYVQNSIIYIIGKASSKQIQERICEIARMIPRNRKVVAYFSVKTPSKQSKKKKRKNTTEKTMHKKSERTTKVTHAHNL